MESKPPIINTTNVNSSKNLDDFFNESSGQENITEGLSPEASDLPPDKRKSKRILKILLTIILLVIVGLGLFTAVRATDFFGKIFTGQNDSLYGKIKDLVTSQTGNKLIGEKNDQINILLLGIGGAGHDGPYLSDTIIVAQIKPSSKKATLTSIPRDYLVNTKDFGQRKINAVFAENYDKYQDWDKAGQSTLEVIEKISGLEIPYFAVVDFEGFKQSVDLLGGIDVTIERGFTDSTFPDSKQGYIAPVTFKEGVEKMNGERALIYARSRHASGPEGSDFARSTRQQQIISATKQKITSLNIVTDASKINQLFTIVGDHFHTNLTPGGMIRLYNLTKDFGQDSILSLNLNPETNIICSQILETNGAFVLTLCPGKTNQDIIDFFAGSFDSGAISSEGAVVWLADSTVAQKLYKKAETELNANGLTVYKVIYTGSQLKQTVVYPVNQKEATINLIKSKLKASEVSLAPPGIKIDPKKVDVIVILGEE